MDEKARKMLDDMREFVSYPNHKVKFGYDDKGLFAQFLIDDMLVFPAWMLDDDFTETFQKLVDELIVLTDKARELGLLEDVDEST